MNLDNRRLREIQRKKQEYGILVLAAESEEEVEQYYDKIDELTEEEKQILARSDVYV